MQPIMISNPSACAASAIASASVHPPVLSSLILTASYLPTSDDSDALACTLSSAQTLARMLNYSAANLMLEKAGPAAPYWEASAIAGVALLLALAVVGPMLRPDAEAGRDGSDARPAEAVVPRS